MIRYKFTEADLIADIASDDVKKSRKQPWLVKAKRLTSELKKNPAKKIVSEWGEIKSVYTERQQGKCAFCERLLGKHELASVEFDVEHFRPKNAVKAWPPQETIDELKLPADFPRSPGKGKGYRLLAYHHLNYASSCKTCNSRLKASFFPIAGRHVFAGTDPVTLMQSELPYLVYPLCDFDNDPEDIISFQGYLAVPHEHPATPHHRDRARVTIAFFRLNEERDDLLEFRAKQLDDLLTKLELMTSVKSANRRKELWEDIQLLGHERSHHAGCVRSLLKLHGDPDEKPVPKSRAQAMEYLKLARDYWRSKYKDIRQ
jgi:hypothetical protein